MKNKIELTVEHKDHHTVELTNGNGDTFRYNPQKHAELEEFLRVANIKAKDMETEKELLERLLKFIDEPIVGHPSRLAESIARKNEYLIKTYFNYKLLSLKMSGY